MAVDYSSPFSFTKSTVGITKYAEICIGYLNAWAGEGGDRSEVRNAKQDNLVSTVADNCKMNASGRLVHTIAKNESDYDANMKILDTLQLNFTEGNNIDYKWFDADISFSLRGNDLSIWDVAAQNWKIEKGTYTFYVGASSRDLKASTTLTI